MVGTDLEGLGLSHNQADLAGLLVLKELHSPGTSLLPLVPIFIEPIELRFPAGENQNKIVPNFL